MTTKDNAESLNCGSIDFKDIRDAQGQEVIIKPFPDNVVIEQPMVPRIKDMPIWTIPVSEKGSVRGTYLMLRDFAEDRTVATKGLAAAQFVPKNSNIHGLVAFVSIPQTRSLAICVRSPTLPDFNITIDATAPVTGAPTHLTARPNNPEETWYLR